MCADDIQSLVQLGSQLARLSRFQLFFETAASRSSAVGADDIQCLVQLGSFCSPFTLSMVLWDGCLTLWRDECRWYLVFGAAWLTARSPLMFSMVLRDGCLALWRYGCRWYFQRLVQFDSHLATLTLSMVL